ncbi:MAG: SusF/SusE family outer membrane protein [Alloprevotella sp.]
MKKIFSYALMLLCSLCVFTACDDDHDSNPVIQHAKSFQLNTPPYAGQVYDLARTSSLSFTWSQPDWGFPVVANYYLQVSLDGNYTVSYAEAEADESGSLRADYIQFDTPFVGFEGSIKGEELAKLVQQIAAYEEDAVPAEQTLYIRMLADVPVSGGVVAPADTVSSNVVTLTVAPYYVELKDASPEIWYLIGACVGDGSWTNSAASVGTSLIPMNVINGYEYDTKTGQGEITFTGYLTTAGFKLVKTPGSWDDQWGQSGTDFVKNDGGSSDIKVAADGYYTITLNTKTDKLTIVPYEGTPTVYPQMMMAGDFNGWDVSGNPAVMTPVTTVAGMPNHVWTYTLDASAGNTSAKFLVDSTWQPNWGAGAFPYGVGTNDGPNVPVSAGVYTVIFNDITGSYNFIQQ